MAVKTFRLSTANSVWNNALWAEADQTAATRPDGWVVGKVAAANASDFATGAGKAPTGSFGAASGYPLAFSGGQSKAMRAANPLTGTFAATAWTFTFAVRATVVNAQRGRVRLRVYKATDEGGGDGLVELTGATQIGTTSALLSTSADVTTVVSWTPAAPIVLANEYLFFIAAWEITTAGGSNTADVQFRTGQAAGGSRIVTSNLAVGAATVERSAALSLVGLIATIGRELLARTAVLNAAGLVASSGARVVPATARSAALTASGSIATVGRELLPRTAALNAAGLVATRGIRIKSRSAALAATGQIATVGRETLSRSAALSATASIASAGREQLARLVELGAAAQVSVSGQVEGGLVVVSRSASFTATAGIASAGRELLPRTVAVGAAAQIATVGRRRLHRSGAVAVAAAVSVSGEILGAASRAAQVTATGLVAARPQRVLRRSATVSTAPTVAATGRLTLTRTAALEAVAAITTTAGKTGQAEFTALATITLSRYLEPGWITNTATGRIAVIYHGQLDGGSLGGLEFPGPDEGELAVGTVGGIARTGG